MSIWSCQEWSISLPTNWARNSLFKSRITFLRFVREKVKLFVDGVVLLARLCPENDVGRFDSLVRRILPRRDRVVLFSREAVVIPNPQLPPHAATIIKQHGALLMRRLPWHQFDELFKDKLYQTIGSAISYAKQIRLACKNVVSPFILKIQPIKSSVVWRWWTDEKTKQRVNKIWWWEKAAPSSV